MLEYKPHVPETIDELLDHLASMMFSSPKFNHTSGFFLGMNIDTEFFALNEGLKKIRLELGEDIYFEMTQLSDRMRTHFEADPEDKTDGALKGRAIIHQMEDLLTQAARRSNI